MYYLLILIVIQNGGSTRFEAQGLGGFRNTQDQWFVKMDTVGELLIMPPSAYYMLGDCQSAVVLRWGFGLMDRMELEKTSKTLNGLINQWPDLNTKDVSALIEWVAAELSKE